MNKDKAERMIGLLDNYRKHLGRLIENLNNSKDKEGDLLFTFVSSVQVLQAQLFCISMETEPPLPPPKFQEGGIANENNYDLNRDSELVVLPGDNPILSKDQITEMVNERIKNHDSKNNFDVSPIKINITKDCGCMVWECCKECCTYPNICVIGCDKIKEK
ncbi:MAG: hypothetical protein GY679_01610 [Mycoplasma sp.]|nr:hypothetical protein [Mycoplasma sp.]